MPLKYSTCPRNASVENLLQMVTSLKLTTSSGSTRVNAEDAYSHLHHQNLSHNGTILL